MNHYILDGHVAKPAAMLEWARWAAANEPHPHVGDTTVDGARVSTVFLGMDTTFGSGPPQIFETMIFGGPHDEFCERYGTWDEAEVGHERIVELLKAGLPPD